ncbi:hypothetical protein TGGT1_212060 [Toxoplasma gondii GT1]|uniref:Uncharacterized protein n=2 Tax=Toxoplasma gondii TaxID=5811 RepID=S7UWH0_TOXGG|nr:hypothetical protein TGGT1_212060 [Toxoplasma gondii GT1]KAF4640356.1 hypothetical protein TGRH88_042820 [Toxoplasma gondii]
MCPPRTSALDADIIGNKDVSSPGPAVGTAFRDKRHERYYHPARRLYPTESGQVSYVGHTHSADITEYGRLKTGDPSELLTIATFNGKFRAIHGIKHRLAENSILSIGELAAIGNMPTNCCCLVRVWQGPFSAASMAKLEVKAQDRRVAAAVFELLVYAMEDEE